MDSQKLLFHYNRNGDRIYYSCVNNKGVIRFIKTTLSGVSNRDTYYLLWGEFLYELHKAYTKRKSVSWDSSMLVIANILHKKQKTEGYWHYCSGCFRPFEIASSKILEDERGEHIWGRFKNTSVNSRLYLFYDDKLYKCKRCFNKQTY